MRTLRSSAAALPQLTESERTALSCIADGISPRDVAERTGIDEDQLYRLVAWVLDELEPAPHGDTMREVHARHGSRAADPGDFEEFERRFGASLQLRRKPER